MTNVTEGVTAWGIFWGSLFNAMVAYPGAAVMTIIATVFLAFTGVWLFLYIRQKKSEIELQKLKNEATNRALENGVPLDAVQFAIMEAWVKIHSHRTKLEHKLEKMVACHREMISIDSRRAQMDEAEKTLDLIVDDLTTAFAKRLRETSPLAAREDVAAFPAYQKFVHALDGMRSTANIHMRDIVRKNGLSEKSDNRINRLIDVRWRELNTACIKKFESLYRDDVHPLSELQNKYDDWLKETKPRFADLIWRLRDISMSYHTQIADERAELDVEFAEADTQAPKMLLEAITSVFNQIRR